ncbi:hypothetical protein LshimejAT787_0212420 [Lyophyllum shimeji]|uniref:DUF7702 domain-containing protein n=1 Tax=Lyophyllum shimeji TaxID=47721 RepID=A0A9P3PGL0_LYOSH|nr:hypothetical protein LshimejAT787_0212420 [Lyophyllum shimeji]
MSAATTTYAAWYGINSVPAAALFAILYLPMFILFVYQSFERPSPVFYSLAFFCIVRMVSFVLRAMIASPSDEDNVGMLIGDQILFSIGFFSLLYSAYTLVLDREIVSDYPISDGIISRVIRRRTAFRLTLVAAIILGSVGLSDANSTDPETGSVGTGLHEASTIIFLVLVVLLAYQTVILAIYEFRGGGFRHRKGSPGEKYGIYILLVIASSCHPRVIATATASDFAKQNNEHFWYPLVALPELLAVILYATRTCTYALRAL